MHDPALLGDYFDGLPPDRKEPMTRLAGTIREALPGGFEEVLSSGMPSWVVPHSRYPAGYHCNPKQPLPFLGIASQKRHVAVYHMGVYASPPLLTWFTEAYPAHVKTKLDMGKSCIRFKNMKTIPFALIGELCSKMSPDEWIALYERNLKRA